MQGIGRQVYFTLLIGLAGCATISTGIDQGIRVVTEPGVTGADCTLVDKKNNVACIPNTPGTTYLSRGNGPATITCNKAGYKSSSQQLEEGIAGATAGNIIPGGGIGLIVDAASGAAQRYPDQAVVWMEPLQWDSEANRLHWLGKKQAREQAARDAEENKAPEQETEDL
ncbi:MAG: hypothetical protein HKP57_04375 [Halobacteria archaeon]|nr:hypothetical protein [Halobacteria archaeon]